MNQKVTVYFSKIVNYIKNLEKRKRNSYIILLALTAAVTIIAAVLLNIKNYVVLYRNLDTQECYTIAKRLDDMSVSYKVENDSTIYVDKKDEPRVKMQLASEGYPKSALNYDIFTDNIDFMTTDYEKTKYSLFLLQERLQATIKTLDDINDAIVSITVPDNSFAVLEEDRIPPSASVVLKLKNNVELSARQIKGIERLVAKSVPGLSEKDVSIVDQTGAVINDFSEDKTAISTSSKIKAENEMANIISNRIISVLAPIYGRDKLSVGVNVVLDYSKKATEKTEYIPGEDNTGVIDEYEQVYEGPGNAPANGGVPGTEPNTEIPGYQTPADAEENGSVKKQVKVDYLVSQIKEQVQKEGGEIKDITVSVLIDKKDMPESEASKVAAIVANTSGISKEKVELFYTEFKAAGGPAPKDDRPSVFTGLLAPHYLLVYLACTLALAAFIFISVKKKKTKKRDILERMISEEAALAKSAEEESRLSEKKQNHYIKDLRDFSSKNPQITAMLLRTMLKGDQD